MLLSRTYVCPWPAHVNLSPDEKHRFSINVCLYVCRCHFVCVCLRMILIVTKSQRIFHYPSHTLQYTHTYAHIVHTRTYVPPSFINTHTYFRSKLLLKLTQHLIIFYYVFMLNTILLSQYFFLRASVAQIILATPT